MDTSAILERINALLPGGNGESPMKRVMGIFTLLAVVYIATWIMNPAFMSGFNQENLMARARRCSASWASAWPS